nr:nuclease-related domain-containing protein [Aeromicrobium phoceense]
MRDERQSTKSWATGATGEEQLGAALDARASERLRILHDRRIPGSRANIDHIAVTPAGIWVIDPKRYVDKAPKLRVEGGILRPRVEMLMVAGRNRTKLVDGMLGQCEKVRGVVGPEVPVRGVLCFIEAAWPLFGGDFVVNGVDVLWPRKLYPKLETEGPLEPAAVEALYEQLGRALPPA